MCLTSGFPTGVENMGALPPPPLEEGCSKFDGGLESVHEGNMGVSHGVKSLKKYLSGANLLVKLLATRLQACKPATLLKMNFTHIYQGL